MGKCMFQWAHWLHPSICFQTDLAAILPISSEHFAPTPQPPSATPSAGWIRSMNGRPVLVGTVLQKSNWCFLMGVSGEKKLMNSFCFTEPPALGSLERQAHWNAAAPRVQCTLDSILGSLWGVAFRNKTDGEKPQDVTNRERSPWTWSSDDPWPLHAEGQTPRGTRMAAHGVEEQSCTPWSDPAWCSIFLQRKQRVNCCSRKYHYTKQSGSFCETLLCFYTVLFICHANRN